MRRAFLLAGAVAVTFLVLFVGLYAYRSLMLFDGRTPEGYEVLTGMPGSSGFQPTVMPAGPILRSRSDASLAVDFGYKVGPIPYSYSLALTFPPKSLDGQAALTVRHTTRSETVNAKVVRRWDEPRRAYSVALEAGFDLQPKVPSLCIKAVIGPSLDAMTLEGGSLCVAERDPKGQCHPETLACGLLRN